MSITLPALGQELNEEQVKFLETFTKACRKSIIQMVTNAQSGHPGGSLSTIDYLATLYAFILGQTGEKVVISHGHVSPSVYSSLAEMGYINKEEVVRDFRKFGSDFEGHITRHVDGVWFGTGPLGVGVSVAAAFAMAEKLKGSDRKAYALMGDGEVQEGQVHEMIHFAKHHNLNNLVLFVDYNKVQLTASLKDTLDIDVKKTFEAGHWNVIDIDGHNYQEIWKALSDAQNSDKPTAILGNTIMGKGVDFMQETGENHDPAWHGKAPKPEQIEGPLKALELNSEEQALLDDFRSNSISWKPEHAQFPELLSETETNTGTPIRYPADEVVDCRSAYGKALLDLAKNNKNVIALTADVKGSVMTKFVAAELPEQYIECGIAEQHMMSAAGGLSLSGFTTFASTFGAFLSSRPKDQARVNDINYCNVKMVATHSGLSVGEDGPTHQAIDDTGTFLGMFNTMVVEPCCPNQTDAIIRYVASHYGNFYVRMGRHKFPIITKEDGSLFFDENYKYEYGACHKIREGSDITIVATGACVNEALQAHKALAESSPELSVEIVAVSSIKQFDDTLLESIKKTGKVITVEDHNSLSGLGSQLALELTKKGIHTEAYKMLSVEQYQLSGKAPELYKAGGIDAEAIVKACKEI
jgi:transketolase